MTWRGRIGYSMKTLNGTRSACFLVSLIEKQRRDCYLRSKMFYYNQNNYFEEAVLGIVSRMTSNILCWIQFWKIKLVLKYSERYLVGFSMKFLSVLFEGYVFNYVCSTIGQIHKSVLCFAMYCLLAWVKLQFMSPKIDREEHYRCGSGCPSLLRNKIMTVVSYFQFIW